MAEPIAETTLLYLAETDRARQLCARAKYYKQEQNDHLETTWDGWQVPVGVAYEFARQRGHGFVPIQEGSQTPGAQIPLSARRPLAPTMITGLAVQTYTALLLGDGRQPSIRINGDDDTTAAIHDLFVHGGFWGSLSEVRTIAGCRGAAAVVPQIRNGVPRLRPLKPENLHVEWSTNWIPSLVIEQKLVQRQTIDPKTGRACAVRLWQTQAWDEEYAYTFEEIAEQAEKKKAKDDDAPEITRIKVTKMEAHGAGRCPVVWVQNTQVSDEDIGEADVCPGGYQLIDVLDQLRSRLLRGTQANADPTLWVSDTVAGHGRWKTRAKGYGRRIDVTEKGKVGLLEITGKTFEVGWAAYDRVEREVLQRLGLIAPSPDNAGAYQSGVALQILYATQDIRVGDRRMGLANAIKQLVDIWVRMLRKHGIKAPGAVGKGIEIPLRACQHEDDDGEIESSTEPHVLGKGGAVQVTWPPHRPLTPQDIQAMAQGLTIAAGGRAIISQQSAVGVFASAVQLPGDAQGEAKRLHEEEEARVAVYERDMLAGAPGDEGEDDESEESGEDMGSEDATEAQVEPGSQSSQVAPAAADGAAMPADVAKTAMNGAQIQGATELFAKADVELSPETTKIIAGAAFPGSLTPQQIEEAVNRQVDWAKSKPKPDAAQPMPAPVVESP